MSNHLSPDKKIAAVAALVEGSSIRAIERMTGVHRDTIMRLGVRVGEACAKFLDEIMRELTCSQIQIDEIWGYIGKKQKNTTPAEHDAGFGDVWTYVALDSETKVVPCFTVGKRNWENTNAFIDNLASRVVNRIQLSSDAMNQYLDNVETAFGSEIDYGQIVKVYGDTPVPQGKYSKPPIIGVKRAVIFGKPEESLICTSHVERQNLTMRMHIRRLTRLTNAFSKKLENFKAAVSLHYAYYNFCLIHKSLRMTPAMAANITDRIWKVQDLVGLPPPDPGPPT